MRLKLNTMYKTDTGYLIPRSHMTTDTMPSYCIIEILKGGDTSFKVEHKTMTRQEIRTELKLKKNERIEIV